MQSACGKTLDETLNFYQRYYDNSKPLPFLLIETWNDYEEGTAIERRTETNCGSTPTANPARIKGDLSLSVTTARPVSSSKNGG